MFADFSSREYPDSSAEKLIFRIDGRQNCRDLLAGKRPVKIYSRAISTLRTYVSTVGTAGTARGRVCCFDSRNVSKARPLSF